MYDSVWNTGISACVTYLSLHNRFPPDLVTDSKHYLTTPVGQESGHSLAGCFLLKVSQEITAKQWAKRSHPQTRLLGGVIHPSSLHGYRQTPVPHHMVLYTGLPLDMAAGLL